MTETIQNKDEVQPGAKWEFDDKVTVVFDDMLQRSIPQYEVMRDACFSLGSRFVEQGTAIIDLGCSRGEAMAKFIDRFGAHNRFIGVDVSEPMLEACRKRFDGMITCSVVSVCNLDLRKDYPEAKASLTLAVLVLQFTPIEYRQSIVRKMFEHTTDGGAVVLVEKVIGSNDIADKSMVSEYYDMKRRNGYTEDQIQRKKLSLEGVLVPVTAAWNEDLLRNGGFSTVECFWRWMNFAGWIAIKNKK